MEARVHELARVSPPQPPNGVGLQNRPEIVGSHDVQQICGVEQHKSGISRNEHVLEAALSLATCSNRLGAKIVDARLTTLRKTEYPLFTKHDRLADRLSRKGYEKPLIAIVRGGDDSLVPIAVIKKGVHELPAQSSPATGTVLSLRSPEQDCSI
jgi:hypothetical protein